MNEDTDYTDDAVCPYCGYTDPDSWEFELGCSFGEGSGEADCNSCGRTFYLTRHIAVAYTSKRGDND